MSAISSIHTALSALMASQQAIEVTGHNIANVNTPGYHRQQVVLQARPPYPQAGSANASTGGQLGTGVDVVSIRRLQGIYLQQQASAAQGEAGRWNLAQQELQQLESILAPGEGTSLNTMLDQFFSAWQQLAGQADRETGRQSVRAAAVNLTGSLNSLSRQLDQAVPQMETELQGRVDKLNQSVDALVDLNTQIMVAQAEGRETGDLLDQRQQVMSEMANLAGVTSLSGEDSTAAVNLNGHTLVQRGTGYHLRLDGPPGAQKLVWANDGSQAQVTRGEIAGIVDVRDHVIPSFKTQLDDIAGVLTDQVNALHETGVTMDGNPAILFFTGRTAGSISVNTAILADDRAIAATRTPNAPADGSLAREISQLSNSAIVGHHTLAQAAQGITAQIGNAVLTAQTNALAGKSLATQLANQQAAVSGVSMDEELSNLLVYQRAYDAAARVLTTSDELLRTLLERLG